MKKRFLAGLLTLAMLMTLAPVAFAADSSVGSYNDLVAAIENAEDGDTITLSDDINVTQTIVVQKILTLNLADHKISNSADIWEEPKGEKDAGNNWSLISVRGNGDLTITGNGTMAAKSGDCYAVDTQDTSAVVTIENGTFVGNIHAVYVEHGTVYIKGGSYSIQQTYYPDQTKAYEFVLNCLDEARAVGEAKIIVSGGSFANFNPADCKAEAEGTNFCAEGYTTTQNGTTYTVGEGENTAVANAGANYNTVANAVSAVENGGTVTLLKDVTENVVIPSGKTITFDLNGKNIKPTTGCAIVNKGNLTIIGTGEVKATQDSMAAIANFPDAVANLNGGTYTSAEWYVIKNMGQMTIDGTVTVKKPDGSTDTASLIDNGWVSSTDPVAGENVNAQANKATLTIKNGAFEGKSGSASCSVVKNDDYGTLKITGGTFDSTANNNAKNATTILNWNIAEITGGTFTGNYPISNGAYNNNADKGQFTISGGEFTGSSSLLGAGQGGNGVGKLVITGGNFKAPEFGSIKTTISGETKDAYTVEISSGYFTFDPSAYCVVGKTGVESDKEGYQYMVGTIKTTGDNEVKSENKAGETTAAVSDTIDAVNTADAKEVGKSVKPTTALTDTTQITENDKEQALTALVTKGDVQLNNGAIPAGTTVTVVKETYLDVTVTAYDTDKNEVAMEITPKYNLIAVATTGDDTKEVTLKSAQDTTVTAATKVSVSLPDAFKGQKVYITHKNDIYVATADADGKIEFTTNGFSPFTFSLTNSNAVAEVNGNAYKTLQEAANAANNGDEITVNSGASHTLDFNTTKSVKVTNKTGAEMTVKFNGTDKNIDNNATETFSYTRPSSGSGSTSTTYAVNVNAATNGAVAADKKTAAKGTTVTVTATPSAGYVVDSVKVVDKDGKDVAVTAKDGKYVFTMPASAVTVTATFKAETPAPSGLPFTDVKSGDWFYDAVKYAYENGLMKGTSETIFAPNGTMNRAMIVTVLYRLEKSPAVTAAAKFTDVPAGQWYSDAVAWAAANNIVNGYDETTFGPLNAVTREQMAAILYRYEQYKGLENVTLEENLNRFPDKDKISSYAVPALQWAVGQKVINGNADGTLDPTGTATRAQVAQIFMNLLNK